MVNLAEDYIIPHHAIAVPQASFISAISKGTQKITALLNGHYCNYPGNYQVLQLSLTMSVLKYAFSENVGRKHFFFLSHVINSCCHGNLSFTM